MIYVKGMKLFGVAILVADLLGLAVYLYFNHVSDGIVGFTLKGSLMGCTPSAPCGPISLIA